MITFFDAWRNLLFAFGRADLAEEALWLRQLALASCERDEMPGWLFVPVMRGIEAWIIEDIGRRYAVH